ncbi:MAG: carbohydrate ABC transporter permease [Actinomycetota bacterium]
MSKISISLNKRSTKGIKKFFSYLFISIGALIMIFPFIWMVATSLKPDAEAFTRPPTLFTSTIEWENYTDLWNPEVRDLNIIRMGWNSFYLAFLVASGQVITSSLAGYAFAKLRFPGRNKIFFLYFASIMIPATAVFVPNFIILRSLNLVGGHMGLILPCLTSAYATFLMRQFFLSFPKELEDASKLDGCNPLKFYWYILIPNAKPIIATQFLLTFQWHWNDFQWPLIMLRKEELQTLPVGLSYLSQQYYTDWGHLMAASVMTLIPIVILFLITQRFFIQSIKLTGVKG